jgi:hypothetical protein
VEAAESAAPVDYIYEPSAEAILGDLLPRHVRMQVYRALMESLAGEYGARMTAMEAGHQERQGDDRRPDDPVQQGPSGEDHQGAARHRGRSGSPQARSEA